LPLRAAAQAASSVTRAADPVRVATAPPKERFALVVEDNDRMAELLRLFLEAERFTVVRSYSAEDALLLAPKQPLSLITLDLQLYGMNGWQFLLKLRADSTLARVPVVIIS